MSKTSIEKQQLKSRKRLKLSKRIWELDFIRGICVILMCFDHFMFDSGYLFGNAWLKEGNEALSAFVQFARDYWVSALRINARYVVIVCFFIVCGISCSFSRSNFKRSIEIAIGAILVSIVTSLLNTAILFGVLHMLACSVFLWWVISKIGKNRYVTAALSFIAGVIIMSVSYSLTTSPPLSPPNLPWLHASLVVGQFSSADYFPLMPYAGIVLIGAALGPLLYPNKKSLLPLPYVNTITTPVRWVGRWAIFFYLFHQLIIAGLLALLSYLFLSPGNWIIF